MFTMENHLFHRGKYIGISVFNFKRQTPNELLHSSAGGIVLRDALTFAGGGVYPMSEFGTATLRNLWLNQFLLLEV